MYCRKCDYPLNSLTTTQCPECGRAFDPANCRTFRRRSRTDWWSRAKRWGAMALLLVVPYVGTYLCLVQPVETPRMVWFEEWLAWHPPPIGMATRFIPHAPDQPPTEPTPRDRNAAYRYGGEGVRKLFAPANWVDRRLRRDYWHDYGVPNDLLDTCRALRRIGLTKRDDSKWWNDVKQLDDYGIDLEILAPNSPAHRAVPIRIRQHLFDMLDRYGPPPEDDEEN